MIESDRLYKTVLIDGNWNLKKNFFKRKAMVNSSQKLCGATFGFLDSTRSIINKIIPDRVIVAWDGFNSGKLRYNVYKPYKANREKNWESEARVIATEGSGSYKDKEDFEILRQKIEVQTYLDELYVRQLEEDYIEADDLIAYYIIGNKNPNEHIYIYSRDGDFNQLVSENVSIINPDSLDIITIKNFKQKFGYIVENALLFKCFVGDDADDVPGIKGIGINTLLKYFPDMANEKYTYKRLVDECYENKKKKKLKTFDKIIQAEDELYRNAMLMNLKKPFLNQKAIESVDSVRSLEMDIDRSIETAMDMFIKDGFSNFVGNNYISTFFGPFYSLKAKELEFLQKNN